MAGSRAKGGSGKDATKLDRSGAYAARQLARDVVARGWARAHRFGQAWVGMSDGARHTSMPAAQA